MKNLREIVPLSGAAVSGIGGQTSAFLPDDEELDADGWFCSSPPGNCTEDGLPPLSPFVVASDALFSLGAIPANKGCVVFNNVSFVEDLSFSFSTGNGFPSIIACALSNALSNVSINSIIPTNN